MLKHIKVAFFLVLALSLQAQQPDSYQFREVKTLPATNVKNQERTGTCWSFSCTSFLESELIRLGKGQHDLSEMFVVRNIYRLKCENYVRRQGAAQFGEGGLAHDELNAIKRFGIMPQEAYAGTRNPGEPLNHSQLEKTLRTLCADFAKQGREGKLKSDWLGAIDRALDDMFGPVPAKFKYNGIEYTPVQFRDFLGIKPDDYVTITSFSHHPFWESFILEIPDNWANGTFYNLPLNEMMRCLNYSIDLGYSVEWDADVSNKGFNHDAGLAIVPEKPWKDKTEAEVKNTYINWEKEKNVTQEVRQEAFDRQETMDDHLMHINGYMDELHSGIYYNVKNSWGENNPHKGYVYVSEAYMRMNTISFTVHKEALPTDIRQRLGLEPGEGNVEFKKGQRAAPAKVNNPNGLQPRPDKMQPKIPIKEKAKQEQQPQPKN